MSLRTSARRSRSSKGARPLAAPGRAASRCRIDAWQCLREVREAHRTLGRLDAKAFHLPIEPSLEFLGRDRHAPVAADRELNMTELCAVRQQWVEACILPAPRSPRRAGRRRERGRCHPARDPSRLRHAAELRLRP